MLADAAYGDVTVFREALHRLNLAYAVGISSHLTVFVGTPRCGGARRPPRRGRPPTRFRLLERRAARSRVRTLATTLPAPGLARHVAERAPTHALARRVCRAAGDAGSRLAEGHLAPGSAGCCCSARVGSATVAKYFFIHLPATTAL